jgi:hypothetical protein
MPCIGIGIGMQYKRRAASAVPALFSKLLLEDGSGLLLEDGSGFIILE